MKFRFLIFIFILVLPAGCITPATSSIPTPIPPEFLPTIIAQTAESANLAATEQAIASIPATLPVITPRHSRTGVPQATLTATSIPGHNQAAILITAPGPMSNVISPITLKMDIVTGKRKIVQVDLFGEDGRLLSRLLKHNVPTSTEGVLLTIKIPFEISGTAELGRITVSTQDEYGRVQSLNSVRVVLLSSGINEITTPGNPSEPVGVFSPGKKDSASGGVLTVRADVWPFSRENLILELIDPEGKTLGVRVIAVNEIHPQLVETTIPYQISEPVVARLIIRQDDDRIEGLFYLYSQEVSLTP